MNMDTLIRTYHDVRFRVDHFIISYRQRYYSLDKNPRVIQTKLHNQQLISLRTFPHDRYVVEPTRFLNLCDNPTALNKTAGVDLNSGDDIDNDELRQFTVYNIDELISFEDSYSSLKKLAHANTLRRINNEPTMKGDELLVFDLDDESFELKVSEEIKDKDEEVRDQEVRSPEVSEQPSSTSCGCWCHQIKSSADLPLRESKRAKVGQKLYHFMKSNIDKVTSKGSEFVGEYETSLDVKSANYEKSAEVSKLDELEVAVAENLHPKILTSRKPSLVQPIEPPQQQNPKPIESKKIWKLVLNDVSLSAARLSTGSTTPIVNSQNIRGDFIDAKCSFASHLPQQSQSNKNNENEDIFANHLEQAKLKFLKH